MTRLLVKCSFIVEVHDIGYSTEENARRQVCFQTYFNMMIDQSCVRKQGRFVTGIAVLFVSQSTTAKH